VIEPEITLQFEIIARGYIVVKDTGKKIAEEALQREAIPQQAESKLRSQIRLPAKLRWLERFSWIIPVIQENTAPLVEGIKAKIPQRFWKKQQDPALTEPEIIPVSPPIFPRFIDPFLWKYNCSNGNTLTCEWTQKTLEQNPTAKQCLKCGFPTILPLKSEVRGYRGKYRVDKWLGQRGIGRLYQGVQVPDQQPVVIKEYLLPPAAFNAEETRVRKQAFESMAGLSLADGRGQDIRVILPGDAIADPVEPRCYVVTNGALNTSPCLSAHLSQNGAMTETEVRRVLNQILQSLHFLHSQKFILPGGQLQVGIAHGNIGLNNLLIITDNKEFFIYINDLALWENLFNLPTSKTVVPRFSQDLVDLGYVAFYLLAGKTIDSVDLLPLEPENNNHWPPIDPQLKSFILRLLELDIPFKDAEEARQILLQIPLVQTKESLLITDEIEDNKTKLYRPSRIILGTMGLLIFGSLIWFLIHRLSPGKISSEETETCCLNEISAVPVGKYNYTGESGGSGIYVLREPNLILKNKILEKIIQTHYPKLKLNYQPGTSLETAIENVSSGKSDFAITSQVNQINPLLREKEFAYDSLVVFVAFSYSKRDKSLPNALQGEITFQQLRDLYTGKIKNWREIGGANFPDLPVKLYFPPEQESLRIFEERVLKEPSAIAQFRRLQQSQLIANSTLITSRILQKVLQDFEEDNIGSIGFGKLSKVFGQCSVYPLALREDNRPAIQPLMQDNGNPIDPSTDLCNDKGNYRPNFKVFKTGSYPLEYSIVVVYPGDNSRSPIGNKFADMLRTNEVQHLLEKVGLVPLQSNKL